MPHSLVQLSQLMNSARPDLVLDEVRITLSMIPSAMDSGPAEAVHEDVVKVFRGEFPGYRACNTIYHDLEHTMETFLAVARLIHGFHASGGSISPKSIQLGLITALMHDIGYIQQSHDRTGTGAKYTHVHVERGIEFMKAYLPKQGFSERDILVCRNMIRYTDTEIPSGEGRFPTDDELVGKILGVADLLGQMASRVYLEKLLFLYCEFEEALVSEYEDEKDLLRRTRGYYEETSRRIQEELDGVDRYARPHFRARWGIDHDLYREGVERNLDYLQQILDDPEENYGKYLRRRGLVDAFLEKKAALASWA
ncbi:MAG: HD domain-containing protein [Deltaproteobacteria bacterium]|nr:HD domain-containing protein [Deltaproteobacteria bacterium]